MPEALDGPIAKFLYRQRGRGVLQESTQVIPTNRAKNLYVDDVGSHQFGIRIQP